MSDTSALALMVLSFKTISRPMISMRLKPWFCAGCPLGLLSLMVKSWVVTETPESINDACPLVLIITIPPGALPMASE